MKWYAVKKGKNPGLYNSWDECKKQVIGFPDAEYKSFENKSEAEGWLNEKEKPLDEVDGIAYVDGSFNEKAGLYGFGGFILYKKEKDGKKRRTLWIVGSIALTAVGFIVIPPLLNKVGSKVYQNSIHAEEIDIDTMGPEIVKKEETEEEE